MRSGGVNVGAAAYGLWAVAALLGGPRDAAVAQTTPAEELDQSWVVVCAGAEEGTDFFDRCQSILNAGPGSGDRRSAAALGNNLGVVGAQSRTSNTAARVQKERAESRLDELKAGNSGQGGGAAADGSRGWGLFFQAGYESSDRDASDFEAGYDGDLKGAALGVDYRFSPRFVFGAMIGYGDGEADFDQGAGSLESESTALTVYGSVTPGKSYVDFYLGAGRLDYDSVRAIGYTLVLNAGTPEETTETVTGTAMGETEGDQTVAGVAFGYGSQHGALTIGPAIALDYVDTTIDAYTENDDVGLAMAFEEQSIEALTGTLALEGSASLSRGWGALVPHFRVAWLHEFSDDSRAIDTFFAGDGSQSTFVVNTEDPDRDYFHLSGGFSAVLTGGTQWFLDVGTLFGHEFLSAWSATAGVRVEL